MQNIKNFQKWATKDKRKNGTLLQEEEATLLSIFIYSVYPVSE